MEDAMFAIYLFLFVYDPCPVVRCIVILHVSIIVDKMFWIKECILYILDIFSANCVRWSHMAFYSLCSRCGGFLAVFCLLHDDVVYY